MQKHSANETEGRVLRFLNDAIKNPNSPFIKACEKVGLPPTRRQASKWLANKGKAYYEGR